MYLTVIDEKNYPTSIRFDTYFFGNDCIVWLYGKNFPWFCFDTWINLYQNSSSIPHDFKYTREGFISRFLSPNLHDIDLLIPKDLIDCRGFKCDLGTHLRLRSIYSHGLDIGVADIPKDVL